MTSLGTCKFVMPLSEFTIASSGRLSYDGFDVGFDGGALGFRQLRQLRIKIAETVIGIEADLLQRRGVLFKDILEEDRDRMAEHDGVGDLHHRGLEVQREQHALLLRVLDLGVEELAQGTLSHDGGVDHLAGLERRLLLEHGCGAVIAKELDAEAARLGDGDGLFAAVKIAAAHMGHVRLRVGAPGAHLVGMLARVLLDGGGGAPIRIAFAKDGVHGAAENLRVTRLDLLFGVRLRLLGIIRDGVALALEFLDGRLQLRDGGADVGQLDDVGFRRLREFAEECKIVGLPLLRSAGFQGNSRGAVPQARCPASRRLSPPPA